MKAINDLTQKELKAALYYEPLTGVFTRRTKSARMSIGDIAGYVATLGYIFIRVKHRQYYAQRLAWLYVHGVWPKDQIDHINHVKTDNRISNLREVTGQENQKNRRANKNNATGIIGVTWHKRDKRWQAQATVNNKMIHLGQFTDFFEAVCARMSSNNKYGFHANHGR